ncbi:MAG: signal peptide peptidase SppA, type [Planctomycetaceae bacterium]|nr:signal peptide peptidase SppA, type [Planctomycetaceae bacterium]
MMNPSRSHSRWIAPWLRTVQYGHCKWSRCVLAVVVGLFIIRGSYALPVPQLAAQEKAAEQADAPLGQFITVGGVIDAKKYAKISRLAKLLEEKAKAEKRKAILVLEFQDGPSRFGDVRELAKFLSEQLREVRTVAWIPKDVRGFNVIPVLACNDIIMHPKAGLGDMGRGKPVDRDVQAYVETLVARRHNPLLTNAVVRGMMDPGEEVILVRKKVGAGANAISETDLVTPVQLQKLIDDRVIIDDHKTVKAAGSAGLFNGSTARNGNFLCSQVAEARVDIAKVYGLPREALREDPSAGSELVARRIRIEGDISRMSEEFLNRQIKRMLGEGANLIIFEIDSPGGRLDVALTLAGNIADLDPKKVRTVAYIPAKATSSAAVIALGCDDIVMHPDAQIGNVSMTSLPPMGPPPPPPRGRRGQPPPPAPVVAPAQAQDMLGTFSNVMKSLAEKKQRPASIILAMADKDQIAFQVTNKENGEISFMSDDEIHSANGDWVKGARVDETGKPELLLVNGIRAHELKIAEEPVSSFDELKERYAIPVAESLPPVGPTWVDSLVFLLNDGRVTGMLLVIGFICIYAEMHVPSGLFIIIACVCFGLFFWSRVLGGTADWLEVMLFLLGLGCIALEVFVVPGFGVFGISGAIMVLAALILASQTFFIPTSSADYRELADHLSTLGGSLVGCVVIAFALSRFLPRMPLLNRMVLVPPGGATPGASGVPLLRPELATAAEGMHHILNPNASLIGETGNTVSILRPSGKAQFGDRMVDVVSEGPFIDPGKPIQVIEVNGNRVVVREVV